MGLNPKQQLFVAEYLKDHNAKRSATAAGYSKKTAEQIGYQLLQNPSVAEAVAKAIKKQVERTGITADSILKRLDLVANRCLKAEPVMEFDPVEKEMVQATDEEGRGVYEFDSGGANRALELLGKHLKLFTEKMEIDASPELAAAMAKARARKREPTG